MTSSQWLDIAVLAVAFIAAISGWRSGALGSLLSFVGRGARRHRRGAAGAAHRQPHQLRRAAKLFAALFLILALVVVGEVAGVVLGRAVRGAIRNRAVRTVDSVIGVGVQLVVVLVAAWLLATPLTQSRTNRSWPPRSAARGCSPRSTKSRPTWLKTVPKRLSALLNTSGLPAVSWSRSAAPRSCRSTLTGRGAGRQSGGRRPPPAQRGEDPQPGAELPKGLGGQRIRDRARTG